MLILRGAPALSEFRIKKLQQDLAAAGFPVREIATQFIHVVKLNPSSGLNDDELTVLEKLLTYGPHREEHSPKGLLQIVAPRPGTISPWSSKATDIAHICGLTKIKRIERAIAYWIDLDGATATPALAGKLHDRMTQTVFNDLSELTLQRPDPRPRPHRPRSC
jgi:phosphoribosylformylglycinamidine synthase